MVPVRAKLWFKAQSPLTVGSFWLVASWLAAKTFSGLKTFGSAAFFASTFYWLHRAGSTREVCMPSKDACKLEWEVLQCWFRGEATWHNRYSMSVWWAVGLAGESPLTCSQERD